MNTRYDKPWSKYSPMDDPTASQYELEQRHHDKPLVFSNSVDSPTAASDASYPTLVNPSHQERSWKSPLGYQGFIRWWLPEIVSSIFSVASLLAMIAVLRVYDGRGLDDLRLPNWLTINGLVAVIATLNRVALVAPVEAAMSQEVWLWFSSAKQQSRVRSRLEDLEISDRASRGAWGSFIFLVRGGGRRLSYLGSVVIIISLAFGAFTQQLIGIVSLPVTDSGSSELIPGNIPHSELFMNTTGAASEAGLSTILSIKAAVYNGMLEGNLAPLPASCPTGNCTFPVTPTVAVCGECKNVTYKTSCNSTICQYTLSTGTVMNLTNWFDEQGSYGISFQVVSRLPPSNNGADRLDIATFDVFGTPYDSFASGWPNASTTSSTCSLWMCVNALSVSVKNSQQQQTVTSTFSKLAHNLSIDDFNGGSLINFADLPAEMNPRPGANYSVGGLAQIAVSSFLEPLVSGNVTANLESHIPSSDTIEAIWNGTVNGLDGWVKNLALSMTNAIRAGTPATAPRYNGTAYQSGIRVRWEWLALPVAMVALSLFVLVAVMIETSRARVRAWKGSPLAYLMSEVDQSIKDDVSSVDVDSFKGFENAVGRRRVVLDSQANNGRLIFREVRSEGNEMS